jgi:hypothetical protein
MLALITFSIGSLLLLIAVLILLRRAFATTMLWGLLGLLFVPLYIFALFNWSETPIRKTVYISLVGILAMLVGISGGALSYLPFLPEHEVVTTIEEKIAPPKESPLPNEEAAQAVQLPDGEDYDPLLTGGEFEGVNLDEMIPPASVIVDNTDTPIYKVIELTDLERAVNKRVKLDLLSGDQVEGLLTHYRDGSIVVESFVAGGAVGYSYALDDIDVLSVLDLAPVKSDNLDDNEDDDTHVLQEDPAQ